jgi:pyruvate/2-oxoglutarate dehydrogenase complex dihydrolipoamide acyltransferase (E2) component
VPESRIGLWERYSPSRTGDVNVTVAPTGGTVGVGSVIGVVDVGVVDVVDETPDAGPATRATTPAQAVAARVRSAALFTRCSPNR